MSKKRIFLKAVLWILSIFLIIIIIVPDAYDYMRGYFVFSRLGRDLTVGMTKDFDKAANVAFWVFDDIKGFSRWQRHRFMPVIDDNALNIDRRGFGYCDQGAHVYATNALSGI